MPGDAARPLTERQKAVMERIDRRVPIKMIARELDLSETRINQHIRALKNAYEVGSLGDLVDAYREEKSKFSEPEISEEISENEEVEPNLKGLSKPIYRKSQMSFEQTMAETSERDDPGELVMSDVLPIEDQAPWLKPGEPRVVPRVLDGEYAVVFRLLAIVGIAFGVLAAVVLAVTSAITISNALEGRADVPVDQQGFS
ncbi:MAG: LuxR C-terminal-related transcriptional regulator [Pseudomonadota bacterium]